MKYALFLLLILVCGLMPIGFLLVGISTLCGSDKLYRFGASLVYIGFGLFWFFISIAAILRAIDVFYPPEPSSYRRCPSPKGQFR